MLERRRSARAPAVSLPQAGEIVTLMDVKSTHIRVVLADGAASRTPARHVGRPGGSRRAGQRSGVDALAGLGVEEVQLARVDRQLDAAALAHGRARVGARDVRGLV